MEKISNNIALFLCKKEIVPEKEISTYAYGAEIALIYLVSLASFIVIGVIRSQFLYGLLFSVVFMKLRSVTGGYHASTRFRCYILSISLYLAVLIAIASLPADYMRNAFLPLMLLSNLSLILIAPTQNITNPRSEEELQKNRIKMFQYLLIINVCAVLSWGLNDTNHLYFVFAETLMAVAVLSLINLYQYKKRRQYQYE